ncbi:flagellar motor protein MotB [Legionella dresdenensis]|uniref:Flagellar motor protein MotB n=1 Tax=Legionella dresdenensis TaxID=450200 RepID=A0ABV8CD03_9GAMM
MRGRKSKHIPHEDTHRWMVSYADFITLLFAFFVVMYAISSVNVAKYKSLAQGMHTAFNKVEKNRAPVDNPSTLLGQSASKSDGEHDEDDPFDMLDQALAQLQDADYRMDRQEGWIELDIKAGALFDSGSAELKPLAIIKLIKVAEIIKELPYPVALEGYTDDVPINTPQYPSNWELSSARASALARVLTNYGVDPGRISVTGYGAQFPVATNETEEGRAKNRRVNLIIARDRNVPRLLNPEKSLMDQDESLQTPAPETSVVEPINKESQ